MATLVGTETDLNRMLTHLVKRELDMVAACEAAAERLDDRKCQTTAKTFRDVHRQRAEELSQFLMHSDQPQPIPSRGDIKRLLTRSKVLLADMAGDRAILRAIRSNEEDVGQAYARAINHPDAHPSLRDVLRIAAATQRRHCAWIDERLQRNN